MEEIKLTDAQLILSLRACEDEESCAGCHLGPPSGNCFGELKRIARERLEELAEENRRMRDATEDIVKALAEQMVQLARECNTAQERGLPKASGDDVLVLNQIQARLLELGRVSVVRAVPGEGGTGWTVLGISVEDRVVFGEMLNAECKMQNEGAGGCG